MEKRTPPAAETIYFVTGSGTLHIGTRRGVEIQTFEADNKARAELAGEFDDLEAALAAPELVDLCERCFPRAELEE